MTASVFIGTSLDGFIARPDGSFDFLPTEPEEHGYEAFFASVDALVIGRKTYDTVLAFPEWPYGDKRVVVLSNQTLDLTKAKGAIEQMSGSAKEIVEKLAASGAHNLYIDGGLTIQQFIREGVIDRLIVTRVPVLIGEGIPLFGPVPHDIKLRHIATRSFPSGLVQSEYEVQQ